MKPTDTFWEENDNCDVICVFHGDKHRRTVEVHNEDFPLPTWKVAQLMNDAFKMGVEAKALQLRQELGL